MAKKATVHVRFTKVDYQAVMFIAPKRTRCKLCRKSVPANTLHQCSKESK